MDTSLKTLELRPALLYCDKQSLDGLRLIAKINYVKWPWVTISCKTRFSYQQFLYFQKHRQTGVGHWSRLKSTNLQFSRCYIFESFRNNVDINCTLRRAPFWISAAPIRMTWNDLEGLVELKVRFRCVKPDICMLWLSELTMSDWTKMGLNCQR